MAIIVLDIIDGNSIEDNPEGLLAIRVARVQGLTGNPSAKLARALFAAGVPRRGDPHPSIPELVCVNRAAETLDLDYVNVTLTYKPPEFEDKEPNDSRPPQIRVGTTTQGSTTEIDIKGKPIQVKHTFKKKNGIDVVDPKTTIQIQEVAFQLPVTIAELSRREFRDPTGKSIQFVGKVNRLTFFGGAKRIWLCTAIEGISDDGGLSYQVNYVFQRNPETWDANVIMIDDETGRPPEDLVDDEGRKSYQIYKEVDFRKLRLGSGTI